MKKIVVGVQMLFVAFGALVLVPLITGLDPNVALFTAGAGTLIFHLVTRGKVPVFLASSFAYIAPILVATKLYGIKGTLCGLAAAGLVKMLFGGFIKWRGIGFIDRLLPSYVIGPVIMVIGLSLAPVAIDMIKNTPEAPHNMGLAGIAFGVTVIFALFGKGVMKLTPILAGIVFGYAAAILFGDIDFAPIRDAAWFSVPSFTLPAFNWKAILYIVPVAIAPAIEHIGDIMVISDITGEKFYENPGLHRTMFGDGIATTTASFLGGPPNTTYSEVTGAVALTKVFNPVVMRIAAVTAILLAFFGKVGAILKTIPAPVMGGIMVILFGSIAAIGVKNMIQNKTNLDSNKKLIIVAVILVIGIGGAVFDIPWQGVYGILLASLAGLLYHLLKLRRAKADFRVSSAAVITISTLLLVILSYVSVRFQITLSLAGIGLAGIIGVFLNLILPEEKAVATEFNDI
jgi:uracil permease